MTAPGGPNVTECTLVHQNPDQGLTDQNTLRVCATCPFNRYGSDVDTETAQPRRGKACREKRLILFLRDGESLPVVVLAPPSSLRAVDSFVTLLATRHVLLDIEQREAAGKVWGVLCFKDQGQPAAARRGGGRHPVPGGDRAGGPGRRHRHGAGS